MGTRALRKLREQEWEKQLASSQDEQSEEEEEEPVVISKPRNAFDMLNGIEDDDEDMENDEETEQIIPSQPSPPSSSKPKSSKKKKKKKAKKRTKEGTDTPRTDLSETGEDEIDKALKELAQKHPKAQDGDIAEQESQWEKEATRHLAIEPRNLDPVNEMRGLFGNIALEDDSRRSQPTRRREQNLQGGVDLQTALTGRYNRASQGKELGSLAKRRNCFMQGKEEWPLSTSGGLSMEALSVTGFEKKFNIIHNQLYKAAQWDFRMAVESMQAEAMIGMLQKYPYHLASLLQVSEIAKHQGDNSLSGDLLERALFTLGRSVHSSFPAAMREGVARLDFNKPANRELYLTIWRYIRNLEQRGVWKTAFEWSKILLQLNTTSDPFGVTLMIDQLALRGRQHQQLLDLTSDSAYGATWSHLPNICISKTLALLRAQKPKEARQQLALAMHRYPYLLSALASAIEVTPIPKSIWGKLPSSDAEKLYSELYVTRAKDLWNTPETIGLISEVANTMQYYKSFIDSQPPAATLQVSLEEARHIMAQETPALIALLPRQFTTMPTSSTDILPPPDSEASDLTRRAPTEGPGAAQGPGSVAVGGDLVSRALRWFFSPGAHTQGDSNEGGQVRNLQALREELGPEAEGIPDEVLQQIIEVQVAQDFGELDLGELQQAVVAGPMAGGWNYYDSTTIANSQGNASDDEVMPDLESIGDSAERETEPTTPRGPHAATVEEADSDDEVPRSTSRRGPTTGPVLLRADSDDEGMIEIPETPPRSPTRPTLAPRPRGAPSPELAQADPVPDKELEGDHQRLQRWLIGAGVEETKANPNSGTYVRRLKILHRNQQAWVLNMLRQRGEGDLVKRIEQAA